MSHKPVITEKMWLGGRNEDPRGDIPATFTSERETEFPLTRWYRAVRSALVAGSLWEGVRIPPIDLPGGGRRPDDARWGLGFTALVWGLASDPDVQHHWPAICAAIGPRLRTVLHRGSEIWMSRIVAQAALTPSAAVGLEGFTRATLDAGLLDAAAYTTAPAMPPPSSQDGWCYLALRHMLEATAGGLNEMRDDGINAAALRNLSGLLAPVLALAGRTALPQPGCEPHLVAASRTLLPACVRLATARHIDASALDAMCLELPPPPTTNPVWVAGTIVGGPPASNANSKEQGRWCDPLDAMLWACASRNHRYWCNHFRTLDAGSPVVSAIVDAAILDAGARWQSSLRRQVFTVVGSQAFMADWDTLVSARATQRRLKAAATCPPSPRRRA